MEVTRVGQQQPRETGIPAQEAIRWWRAFRECVRSKDGHHVTSSLGTHFGRLLLLGVFNSEQYEAGLAWHQVINDHKRIILDSVGLNTRISNLERSIPGDEGEYSEEQIRRAQNRYDLCLSTVVDAPRGSVAWDGLVELITLDRHIDWSAQRLVGDALGRLAVVFNIVSRNKQATFS